VAVALARLEQGNLSNVKGVDPVCRKISADDGQYPLDLILTENYLRWHSDPGSADRLSGKADPE
jgi:hypothetical protein